MRKGYAVDVVLVVTHGARVALKDIKLVWLDRTGVLVSVFRSCLGTVGKTGIVCIRCGDRCTSNCEDTC